MPPMPALADQIAELEQLLNTGAESITVDGVSTRINLDQVRQRLRELYRAQRQETCAKRIRLSGGWSNT